MSSLLRSIDWGNVLGLGASFYQIHQGRISQQLAEISHNQTINTDLKESGINAGYFLATIFLTMLGPMILIPSHLDKLHDETTFVLVYNTFRNMLTITAFAGCFNIVWRVYLIHYFDNKAAIASKIMINVTDVVPKSYTFKEFISSFEESYLNFCLLITIVLSIVLIYMGAYTKTENKMPFYIMVFYSVVHLILSIGKVIQTVRILKNFKVLSDKEYNKIVADRHRSDVELPL